MSYDQYIGLEFAEKGRGPSFDCWGLVLHVLKEEFGITGLPDFRGHYLDTSDRGSIPILINDERAAWCWHKVLNPIDGDIVVFSIGGRPMHVGVMINDQQFLHITKGINASVESVKSSIWRNRIEGYYRYV